MAVPPKPSLVLVPGLGADAQLYEPQRRALGERLIVPPWIKPLAEEESLESYARRLVEVIRATPGLVRPFYVGGISFGGMLAAEMAEASGTGAGGDVAGLFLIGACTRREQIPKTFHLLAAAGQFLPEGLGMALKNRLAPAFIAWWQGLDARDADLYAQTYARGSFRLLQWGARAMSRWQTTAEPRCPVYCAHGRKDNVIPIDDDRLRPGIDLVVPDGKHLIHLTHELAVNRWLIERMDGCHRPPEASAAPPTMPGDAARRG